MFLLKSKTLNQLNQSIFHCINSIDALYIRVLKNHGGYTDPTYYARIDVSDSEMIMPEGADKDTAYQICNTRLNH